MLKHIAADSDAPIMISFDGRNIVARRSDSVASALLAAGEVVFRTSPVSGAPRGPFCMMGGCFECLVEIDGMPNRQGCMIPVSAGMVVCCNGQAEEVQAA